MKYVECPKVHRAKSKAITLFLGGGITSCPQWQPEIVKLLEDTNLTILNPRRENFDVNNPDIEKEQIIWEFKHLQKANAIMFWFPCETLCPITLFELGKWVVGYKPLFIGCHPEYKRKNDVRIQVGLVMGKRQKIHDSLESIAKEIIQWEKVL